MPNVAYRLTDNVYSGVTNCYAQCDTNTITFTVGFKLHNFKEFSCLDETFFAFMHSAHNCQKHMTSGRMLVINGIMIENRWF